MNDTNEDRYWVESTLRAMTDGRLERTAAQAQGAMERALAILRAERFVTDVETQGTACEIIALLTSASAERTATAETLGVLETLVSVARRHSQEARALCATCKALRQLVPTHSQVFEKDVMSVVLSCLSLAVEDVELYRVALNTAYALVKQKGVLARVERAQLEELTEHLSRGMAMQAFMTDDDIQHQTLQLVNALLVQDIDIDELFTSKVVDFTIIAMRVHSARVNVQHAGISTLATIIRRAKYDLTEAQASDALEVLIPNLRCHSSMSSVRRVKSVMFLWIMERLGDAGVEQVESTFLQDDWHIVIYNVMPSFTETTRGDFHDDISIGSTVMRFISKRLRKERRINLKVTLEGVLEDVVEAATAHAIDEKTTEQTLSLLLNFPLRYISSTSAMRCLEFALRAVANRAYSTETLLLACVCVDEVIQNQCCASNRNTLMSGSHIADVVALLRHNTQHEELQRVGYRILTYCMESDIHSLLSERELNDVIRFVIESETSCEHRAEINIDRCRILCAVVTVLKDFTTDSQLASDALSFMLDTMDQQPESQDIQISGCIFMDHLLEIEFRGVNSRNSKVVESLLRAFQHHGEARPFACRALGRMIKSGRFQFAQRVLAVLLNGARDCVQSADLVKQVLHVIDIAMADIAKRRLVFELGAVGLTLDALREHAADIDVVTAALTILVSSFHESAKDVHARKLTLNASDIRSIIECIRAYSFSREVLIQTFRLLHHLVEYEEGNRDVLLRCGVVELALHAMQANMTDGDVQWFAVRVLSTLIDGDREGMSRETLDRMSCVVLDAVESHAGNKDLHKIAMRVVEDSFKVQTAV